MVLKVYQNFEIYLLFVGLGYVVYVIFQSFGNFFFWIGCEWMLDICKNR